MIFDIEFDPMIFLYDLLGHRSRNIAGGWQPRSLEFPDLDLTGGGFNNNTPVVMIIFQTVPPGFGSRNKHYWREAFLRNENPAQSPGNEGQSPRPQNGWSESGSEINPANELMNQQIPFVPEFRIKLSPKEWFLNFARDNMWSFFWGSEVISTGLWALISRFYRNSEVECSFS